MDCINYQIHFKVNYYLLSFKILILILLFLSEHLNRCSQTAKEFEAHTNVLRNAVINELECPICQDVMTEVNTIYYIYIYINKN